MIYRKPRIDEYDAFERYATHPLQSYAWGEFRKTTGVEVRRLVGFEDTEMVASLTVTFHALPYLPYTVGYLPKGPWPDEVQLQALRELALEEKALFIKLEPDVSMPPYAQADLDGLRAFLKEADCEEGRALFTPHTFVIDLTQSEDELLSNMKKKTRYNVGLAERNGVIIEERTDDQGFEAYLSLLNLTTKRQGFYAHGETYQRTMWKHMHKAGIATVLTALYQGEVLAAWVLFRYGDRLYYPYGASSRKHREVMASSLLMWEAMRYGKRHGCRKFDLWGALGEHPDPDDPWFGFHRFKAGFGGELATFVGSYDLVIDSRLYPLYRLADRWRWRWLRFRQSLPFAT